MSRASRDQLVYPAQVAMMVETEKSVNEVLTAVMVPMVEMEIAASRGQRVHLVTTVLMELTDPAVSLALPVQLESAVKKDPGDQLDLPTIHSVDPRESLGPMVVQAKMAVMDRTEKMEEEDLRDDEETAVIQVNVVEMALTVKMVSQVSLMTENVDPRANPDSRVRMASAVLTAKTVLMALMDHVVHPVMRVSLVSKVHEETKDHRVNQVSAANTELMDHRVIMDWTVKKVTPALMA